MTDTQVPMAESDVVTPPVRLMTATWRYVGDRTAADLAYCARFALDTAPEPVAAVGGGLSYPLPSK